ncbi:MAG: hypothetical protein RL322_904 [Pseudomonadota bacterium]|jgi:hypothetical protein
MNDETIIAEIEAQDARRLKAVLERDRATLEHLLGAELIYVHASGTEEDRALYLQRVIEGYYDYRGFKPLTRRFRVFPGMVLVNGDIEIDVVARGTAKLVRSRYCQAWALREGQWQMVTWQSTPMPAA